jgi:hypothetical protein
MKSHFDRNKSLQELEHDDWGEPTYDSHLVRTCHLLRRKPLIELTIEDLRLMIGQGIGLPYVVPMALDHLEADPLAEGDFYEGDLVTTVLKIDETFWISAPDSLERVQRIISQVRFLLPRLDEPDRHMVVEALQRAAPCLLQDSRREPQIGEEEIQRRLREGGGRSLAEIMSDLKKGSRG